MNASENLTVTATASSLGRLPDHREVYGFWLYDPQGNFVANGNPDLVPERALGLEFSASISTRDVRIRLSAGVQRISNYIAAMPIQSTVEGFECLLFQ